MTPARTRFAPSPTGSLHVGGARTALYCLLWARRTGGQFILRIEDTDRARSTDEAAAGILRDMRWLGLLWDEGPEVGGDRGPYYQSKRLDRYNVVIDQLLASGHAYEAWETPAELDALRKESEARKEAFKYRRRAYTDVQVAEFRAAGRTPVIRLLASTAAVTVDDLCLGPVTLEPDQLDDIVIRKTDGFPTYHLAVVVDDHDMGVTLVLRGQEHLMNTHKHRGIAAALGWTLPQCAHLPLIHSPSGGKMSKRDKAKTARASARDAAKIRGTGRDWSWIAAETGHPLEEIELFMKKKRDGVALAEAIAAVTGAELPLIDLLDFRRAGYLPEAIVNYLSLLGWRAADETGAGDREVWPFDELCAAFEVTRIKSTPARFDPQKLAWMSGEYMKTLPHSVLVQRLAEHLEVTDSVLSRADDAMLRALFEMYRQRAVTFVDLAQQAAFFFERPTTWGPPKAIKKHLLKGGGLERLALCRAALAEADFTAEGITACLDTLAATHDQRVGRFAQPIRIAVSGGPVSPGIDDTLVLVGKDETLARIDACLTHFTPPNE
jgi:glutamyl-tRNA synthetase